MSEREWDKEQDIDKVKSLANQRVSKLEDIVTKITELYKSTYTQNEYMSFMVSKDNRAVLKFSNPPTPREVEILIHAVYLQKECLEDTQPPDTQAND